MNYLKLPALRTVVENISLKTVKLDKILAESQSRVASYLDIRYPDCQEIIFLLGGKAVKAGRFSNGARTILDVKEALSRLKVAQEGTIGFYEISKLLMIVILGTFIFEPTHAKLKSKRIDFKGLIELLERKHFVGYLELNVKSGLNYLTFFDGKSREGYFAVPTAKQKGVDPQTIISKMVEQSDEKGEINVYESVGEQDLHDTKTQDDQPVQQTDDNDDKRVIEQDMHEDQEKDQFTSEMIDLCLVAIYEEFFRIMVTSCSKECDDNEINTMFLECLKEASFKNPILFRGVGSRDDGSLLPTGLINFERLLKSKETLPSVTREKDFLQSLVDLAWFRLSAMQRRLSAQALQECLQEMNTKIATCKRTYQGSFTIIKFLYSFSRLIEKIQTGTNEK